MGAAALVTCNKLLVSANGEKVRMANGDLGELSAPLRGWQHSGTAYAVPFLNPLPVMQLASPENNVSRKAHTSVPHQLRG